MHPRTFTVEGILHNKNTIDGFKTCDKKEMIKEVSNQVKSNISTSFGDFRDIFFVRHIKDVLKFNYI